MSLIQKAPHVSVAASVYIQTKRGERRLTYLFNRIFIVVFVTRGPHYITALCSERFWCRGTCLHYILRCFGCCQRCRFGICQGFGFSIFGCFFRSLLGGLGLSFLDSVIPGLSAIFFLDSPLLF
ncbi:Uncharacterised protein [Salmonella enterica subsp. enterica serovar Bovismorbificans]|uniref:Uncharacterized protein n=1 Tax=Salmonella enterica subsp. enterica serovar Bovismorbificans TaxID=58097 RepID=A0A655DUN5_SALET|nr:Uncharacterised protein [Salmonella enterica subsp. enterica serovar Bovismorbificans]